MKKLLVIIGATSTGKTDLALRLAEKFNGELVACDSRQVYKGLDIGTGKMPGDNGKWKIENGKWIFNGIPIHMYDVADPDKQYTVYDYVKDANIITDEIFKRGKLPIIVGGTGLYLKALLEGLPNLGVPVNLKLRNELENLSLDDLQKKLQKLSPQKWEKMNNSDRQNPRRLIRAIEILRNSKFKGQRLKLQFKIQNFNLLMIGLTAPREILYRRIDERIIRRLDQGMIDEAKELHKNGLSFERMKQLGLEYGILADFLEGKIKSRTELAQVLQGKIHGYARRQITWFKREKNVSWFNIEDKNCADKVEKLIFKWYDSSINAA